MQYFTPPPPPVFPTAAVVKDALQPILEAIVYNSPQERKRRKLADLEMRVKGAQYSQMLGWLGGAGGANLKATDEDGAPMFTIEKGIPTPTDAEWRQNFTLKKEQRKRNKIYFDEHGNQPIQPFQGITPPPNIGTPATEEDSLKRGQASVMPAVPIQGGFDSLNQPDTTPEDIAKVFPNEEEYWA